MNIEALYAIYQEFPSVQTDTRKLKKGDIFFALKGPNFNANAFAAKALQAGAAYSIIDDAEYVSGEKTILVDDVLTTLQALAKHHRLQFDIPFIAITGSNGKTTTKELLHAVLASTFITYTTEGNLNNHIGVPLTLLRIKRDAEMAVIEMGANHLREIASYCSYTLPTHGIITNCGKAHLEGFGGEEGVRKGKGELYDHLRSHEGTAFVMWDYPYLRDMSKGIPNVISYGTQGAMISGKAQPSDTFLKVAIAGRLQIDQIDTQLVGEYNLPNVLAAVATADHFKVPAEVIKRSMENYAPSNSRSQLVKKGTNQIILDAYNANPSSMRLAIENFAKLAATDKVLLLGSMAELGTESNAEHQAIIALLDQYKWKSVALVGKNFETAGHDYLQFADSAEAGNWFRAQQFENSSILVKGSRSMQMEKVLGD
ncbi:MAG: UDP-N-acetylmuramoyl-tripeptide--D-alanyl-D-alanine ligase [Gemmatimonadaceae bacterium]|nr:UDP-N-acetylmuramoyl-tripeptide--D-alanyl-D-alanine ligase [Chitinophagaceae bacterium]